MIQGIGIDIIEIHRVSEALKRTDKFLETVFTDNEIKYFQSRNMKSETIAGNFAGKEAFVKAVGTGFIGIEPKDIEILRDDQGKPYINILKDIGKIGSIHISISHSKEFAVANVIIED